VYTHILSPSACLAAPFLLCSSHTTSELDGITLPQILAHTNTHKNTRAQTGRSSPSQPRHVLSEHIRRRAERSTLSHMNGATDRPAVKLLRSHTHTQSHSHACLFQSLHGRGRFRDTRKAARRLFCLSSSLARGLTGRQFPKCLVSVLQLSKLYSH